MTDFLSATGGTTQVSAAAPLPVEDQDGTTDDTAGDITAAGQSVTAPNTDGFSTVTFTVKGTYAGFTAQFEQSDDSGVTYYPVDAMRVGSGVIESGCINLTSASIMWRVTVSGSDHFRVRCTALTSGTASILMSVTALPTSSGAAVTTNFSDVRPDSVNITTQDLVCATATGQSGALLVTGTPTAASFSTYAINGMAGCYFLITGIWTGTLQFEKSIDGGTTYTPMGVHVDSTATQTQTVTGNCSVRGATAGATHLRIRATAAMTGTAIVRMVFAAADTVTTVSNIVLRGFNAVVSLTRTADTAIYLANDVVGAATGSTAALTFPSVGPSGSEINITCSAFEIDRNAVIAGETSYTLHLYSVTPPSALGDNAAWDLPTGDRASYLGFLNLGTPVDLGSTLYVEANNILKRIRLASSNLFGYLVTAGPYTPQSATVHKIILHAEAV